MYYRKTGTSSSSLRRFEIKTGDGRLARPLLLVLLALIAQFVPQFAYSVPPDPDIPARAGDTSRPAQPTPPAKADKPGKPAAPEPIKVDVNGIFNDAVTLKEWIEEGSGNETKIWGLLQAYHVTQGNIGSNPFLKNVITAPAQGKKLGGVGIAPTNTLQSVSSTNPFSASSVADALGSLIAQRFKEEAELVALQELAKSMNHIDSLGERKPLTAAFPRAMGYLGTFNSKFDTLDLKDWSILESDFKADLAAWPVNLPAFLDTQFKLADGSDQRYFVLIATTAAAQIVKHGRSSYQVIDGLEAGSAAFVAAHKPVGALSSTVQSFDIGLDFAAIVSHMLTQNGENVGSTWHSAGDVESLLGFSSITKTLLDGAGATRKYDGINLLLGLSYAKDSSLYGKVDGWLGAHHTPTFDKWNAAELESIANTLDSVAGTFETLHSDTLSIPYPAGSVSDLKPLVDDVASIGNALLADVASLTHALCGPAPVTPCTSIDVTGAAATINTVSLRLDAVIGIVGDVKAKAYPAAIGEAIAFLQSYGNQDPADQVLPFLKDSGPFIAEVASAKTTADAETALQTYSLPAGSYTQKQREAFSITLNSYFGVTAGAETLLGGLEGTGTARTRAHLGFTAPVGLDFNWGWDSRSTKASGFFQTGAWSLFVPVLDVGAVASWRLGSGGGQVSSVTWANIVAPGLYVVWSKKGTPFSIMVGAQYGPELTKISTGGGNTIERAALQFPSIEFTFDIPIFNLYQAGSPSSAAVK
jgi:hypothetical protein